MSRRTRTKYRKPIERFGLNHHVTYSSSNTYYPKAYSSLGKPIEFLNNPLPFYNQGTLCFTGTLDEYQKKQIQYSLNYDKIKTANIQIRGQRYSQHNSFITLCTFIAGMICLLPFYLFNLSCYRKKFYTRYIFNSYQKLSNIIIKFKNTKLLILNIQDNFINQTKISILQRAILRTNIHNIIIRNHCYYIQCSCRQIQNFFKSIRKQNKRQFKFIWQTICLEIVNGCQEQQVLLKYQDVKYQN